MVNHLFRFLMLVAVPVVMLSGCKANITATTYNVENINDFDQTKVVTTLGWPDLQGSPESSAYAQMIRNTGEKFKAEKEMDVKVYGDHTDGMTVLMLAESLNVNQDKFPQPTEILIETQSRHKVGEKTSNGRMEVRFGLQGPVFTSQAPGGLTRFELTITSLEHKNGERWITGFYQGFLRNKDNEEDNRALFVVNGVINQRVAN